MINQAFKPFKQFPAVFIPVVITETPQRRKNFFAISAPLTRLDLVSSECEHPAIMYVCVCATAAGEADFFHVFIFWSLQSVFFQLVLIMDCSSTFFLFWIKKQKLKLVLLLPWV